MNTVGEASLSDHKPKRLRVDLKKRKWRVVKETKKVPKIKWEGCRWRRWLRHTNFTWRRR